MNIESLNVQWSAPDRDGVSFALGNPSAEFWAAWRADKQAVRDLGVRVKPGQGRSWVVSCNLPTNHLVDAALRANSTAVLSPFVPSIVPNPAGTNWSPEQCVILDAARNLPGCFVVKARAGTGKTHVMKAVLAVAPESKPAYFVFNARNKREADAKIKDPRVTITTFNAAGYRVVRSVWPNVKPDDSVEKDRILSVLGGVNIEGVGAAMRDAVAFAKNTLLVPSLEAVSAMIEGRGIWEDKDGQDISVDFIARKVLEVLELSKVRDPQGRISFNDQIWLPVIMNWTRAIYNLSVVDETQDMNAVQLELVQRLTIAGSRMFIVGDDRQTIYTFRGAMQDGLGMMQKKLNAQVLPLTVTYRCGKAIVAVAQGLVPDYQAAPEAPEGLVEEILEKAIVDRVQVGDAVLSRLNAPLMPICLALLRKGIAARIEGRDVGAQLLAIARKLNARSVPDFLRKMDAWSQKQTARAMAVCGKNEDALEAKIQLINDQAGALIALAEGALSVKEIEDRLTNLFEDSDNNPKPAVVLSSVHKAKGLEWNSVYMLMRTFKVKEPAPTVSEEHNLFYVAVTRAKDRLIQVI